RDWSSDVCSSDLTSSASDSFHSPSLSMRVPSMSRNTACRRLSSGTTVGSEDTVIGSLMVLVVLWDTTISPRVTSWLWARRDVCRLRRWSRDHDRLCGLFGNKLVLLG